MKIRGNTVGTTIKPERAVVKATDLTEEQKALARENIGATNYYSTEREEIGAGHDEISAEYIWGRYDALAEKYNTYKKKEDGSYELDEDGNKIPLGVRVQKNEVRNDDGTFVNYEYVISTVDSYSDDGGYELRDGDDGIKKPKYLVMSGIDGNERLNVFSTYRFVCDILRGHNVPQSFKEGVILHVLPVANPWAFSTLDTSTKVNGSYLSHRFNQNKVYLEHNFNCEWIYKESGEYVESVEDENALYKKDATGNFVKYTKTTTANGETKYVKDTNGTYFKKLKSLSTVDSVNEKYVAEKETQAITNWLNANADADLFISYHNSGGLFEIAVILGDSSNYETDKAKKIALRGISRVIPFWKNVIGYPLVFEDVLYVYLDEDGKGKQGRGDRDTIFSCSANTRIKGSSILYAQEKLGIPSFIIETPTYYGTYGEYEANEPVYQPEPIAAGAEALGNILIEFYEQDFSREVITMNSIGEKLDVILASAPVQVIKGTYTPSENVSNVTISGIPANANVVEIYIDSTLLSPPIMSGSDTSKWVIPVAYMFYFSPTAKGHIQKLSMNMRIEYYAANAWRQETATVATYSDGQLTFDLTPGTVLEGGKTYEWTAYCWDE